MGCFRGSKSQLCIIILAFFGPRSVPSKMDKHEAQLQTRELYKCQKEKAPQKGASDTVFQYYNSNVFRYLMEGDPGIEPGTFGSGDQRSIH